MKKFLLQQGDCIEVMQCFPDNLVHAIVTDSPYELGFMSKNWDRSGVSFQKETWEEMLRVVKPGGYLLAFGGSRTYHRIACAIEDAGFQIRDCIMWLYGSGFPKSLAIDKAIDKAAVVACSKCHGTGKTRNPDADDWSDYWLDTPCDVCSGSGKVKGVDREIVGSHKKAGDITGGRFHTGSNEVGVVKEILHTAPATSEAKKWEGWGTALKPAFEPIIVARKPLTGTVAQNVLEHGTGGINIDGCRVPNFGKDAEQHQAEWDRQQSVKAENDSVYESGLKPVSLSKYVKDGRWPANIILDEEAGKMLDEQSGKVGGGGSGSTKGALGQSSDWNKHNNKPQNHPGFKDKGGASRFFYCPKASRKERDLGCEDLSMKTGGQCTDRKDGSVGLKSPRAGAGRTSGGRNTWPTVKPVALMRYLVRLVTPPNGIILDPFMGSGSTGVAAAAEGFRFVGIDMEEEALQIARARIGHAYNGGTSAV